MTYRIYVLRDPRVEGVRAVRYVGATQAYLSDRLKFHLMDANRDDETSLRCEWLRQMCEGNIGPEIVEVERLEGSSCEAASRENFWIDYYEAQGCELLNVRRGGGGLSRSDGRGGPSAWAICKFEKIPDEAIAKHEGVHVNTVANWRRERGYMSYGEKKELFSSLCPEVTLVTSTWDEIVKERIQLEAREILGCSVYENWIERLEESISLTRDVKLLRDEGLEEAVASYCRSLLEMLKEDMLLTGYDAIMELFELWGKIQGEQKAHGDDVTLDDLDVWIGKVVMHKRSIGSDVFQYDHVMDVHNRYTERLREERRGYERDQ